MLDYSPLKKLLKERGMTLSQLSIQCEKQKSVISNSVNKNKPIFTDTLNSICKVLKCNVGDVVKVTDEVRKEKVNVNINWQYLHECCTEAKLSFRTLSEKLGRGSNHLTSKENGQRSIDSEDLVKICNLIGRSPEEFLSD